MQGTVSGWLAQLIIGVLTAGGYLGLCGLMAIELACIPLPSEIILPFAGFLVSQGKMNLVLVATIGALGCNLGSAVAYAVGHHAGRRALMRWGKFVLLSPHDLERADHFFARFGGAAVLIARVLPVLRTFIALPAGIAQMPLWRFHIYTFIGSWPWCFLLAWIGMLLGDRWGSDPRMKMAFHYADYGIVLLVVLAVLWFGWQRWRSYAGSTR